MNNCQVVYSRQRKRNKRTVDLCPYLRAVVIFLAQLLKMQPEILLEQ